MSTPLLSINQVVKQYESTLAVDHISLSIPEGCIFGLLGPNGAGKTTLIRMITTILYQDSGTIELHNIPPNTNRSLYIGYMPEERGLYKKMKVGEQAMYLAQLKGMGKKEAFVKVKEWFEKFEMESWWNKKVEDLSKGMSQKLQFVTTVLHEPKLVILDEPFSGLDPVNTNLIKDEIYNLAQKGTTIIFSTHRMEQVEEICDHIILVNRGSKILDGTVKDIKQQFKQNIFTAEVDHLPAVLQHASFSIVKQKANNLTVKINDGYKSNDVLMHFINQQSGIIAYHEILPSLNEIFIRLVEGTPTARQFEHITA